MVVGNEDGSQTGHGRRGNLQEGAWDAIHVIEVNFFLVDICKNHEKYGLALLHMLHVYTCQRVLSYLFIMQFLLFFYF